MGILSFKIILSFVYVRLGSPKFKSKSLSPYFLEVREDHKEPNASDTNRLEEKRKSGLFTEYHRNSVLKGRKWGRK